MTKVYVDPAADILYASFYIQGLYDVFGRENVRFKSTYFKKFRHDNHFFAFVLINDAQEPKRIVIDFTDASLIDSQALDWCDVYGKINNDGQHQSNKIRTIGPSFGIQIYSIFDTLRLALINLIKASSRIPNKRRFLSDYKSQFKRPKLSDYKQKKEKSNYVFFMASLWKKEKETNTFRANFIRACRANSNIRFEGGFAPRTKNDMQGFEALTTASRVQMSEYLNKILASVVVFNTPAVKDCHGWKLAEYLCMGSAIISTPLKRELPADLKDLTHVVYTNGSEYDIKEKINSLLFDESLRRGLEFNAEEYFSTYLKPSSVVQSLLENV